MGEGKAMECSVLIYVQKWTQQYLQQQTRQNRKHIVLLLKVMLYVLYTMTQNQIDECGQSEGL